MRLGQMFSGFVDRVKNFGLRVGSGLAKIAPKVLKYGSFIAGGVSHLPGVIGTAAGFIHKGLDTANRVIESLPNSSFKEKLQSLSDKTASTVANVSPKIMNVAKSAQVVGDTASKIIDTVKQKII